MLNVIVIGSGPAGHTACIYLARANIKPVMLEGDDMTGGLLTTTKIVENFPGFPDGIDGYELTENFKFQSVKFGTTIISENAIKINKEDDNTFSIYTKSNIYRTKSIIIATGSMPKRLYIDGYDEYWQKGISTCAVCDGGLYCFRNVEVAVIGGGDSACEEALHLTHTASKVYIIHRRDKLRASKIMQDRVFANNKIEMIWNSCPIKIEGDNNQVNNIIIKNNITDIQTNINVKGVFVAIGHIPNSQFVSDLITCDSDGYIITNKKCETNVKGIYACGDVMDPHYRQAITAAGSGCIAALECERALYK